MYERHQKLKVASSTGKDLDLTFGRVKETLEREVQRNVLLEQEVKNFQQRQHHLAKIDMLEKKKPWAVSCIMHGSHGSWKPGKVLEFENVIAGPGKVREFF